MDKFSQLKNRILIETALLNEEIIVLENANKIINKYSKYPSSMNGAEIEKTINTLKLKQKEIIANSFLEIENDK